MITMEQRLRAMQLVGELVKPNEDFFSAAAAKELISLIPLQTPFPIELGYENNAVKPPRGEAYAAGVGNVPISDFNEGTKWAFGQPDYEAVGDVKIMHTRGRLFKNRGRMIMDQMWLGTHDDKSGRSCRLDYDFATKEPKDLALYQLTQRRVRSIFNRNVTNVFSVYTYRSWKKLDFTR